MNNASQIKCHCIYKIYANKVDVRYLHSHIKKTLSCSIRKCHISKYKIKNDWARICTCMVFAFNDTVDTGEFKMQIPYKLTYNQFIKHA